MRENITLLDGAVGTSLWNKAEARDIAKKPVWTYNVTHPELVKELALEYLDAGEVMKAGVRILREAVGNKAKVCMAVGPLTAMLEPYGDMEEEECQEIYEEQIGAGMEEHPDSIMLMTFMDLEMMRIATTVARQYAVPLFCSMTFEKHGKTLMGNSVQQIIDTLVPMGIDVIGMNCSLGPDLAMPIIREFSEKTKMPLMFKPNAGKPIVGAGGEVTTGYDATTFVNDILPAVDFVDYIGGCCGSDPGYIRALKSAL